MKEALTPVALNQRVAEIGVETSVRLALVPHPGRAGDWEALIHKHREMLGIIESFHRRIGDLQPPERNAAAFRRYHDALRHSRAERRAGRTWQ